MDIIVEDGTGLPNANSYASVAEGDAYHAGHLYPEKWTAAVQETKEKALAMATRTLDASTRWKGARASATQALAWPRTGVRLDGHDVEEDAIPQAVKNATAELARLLIAENLTVDVAQNDLEGINLGKGALQLNFRAGSKKRAIPSIVDQLLLGLGDIGGGQGGITIARVSR